MVFLMVARRTGREGGGAISEEACCVLPGINVARTCLIMLHVLLLGTVPSVPCRGVARLPAWLNRACCGRVL